MTPVLAPLKVTGYAEDFMIHPADPNEVTIRFSITRTATPMEILYGPLHSVDLEEGSMMIRQKLRADGIVAGIRDINDRLGRIEEDAAAALDAIAASTEVASDALKNFDFDA